MGHSPPGADRPAVGRRNGHPESPGWQKLNNTHHSWFSMAMISAACSTSRRNSARLVARSALLAICARTLAICRERSAIRSRSSSVLIACTAAPTRAGQWRGPSPRAPASAKATRLRPARGPVWRPPARKCQAAATKVMQKRNRPVVRAVPRCGAPLGMVRFMPCSLRGNPSVEYEPLQRLEIAWQRAGTSHVADDPLQSIGDPRIRHMIERQEVVHLRITLVLARRQRRKDRDANLFGQQAVAEPLAVPCFIAADAEQRQYEEQGQHLENDQPRGRGKKQNLGHGNRDGRGRQPVQPSCGEDVQRLVANRQLISPCVVGQEPLQNRREDCVSQMGFTGDVAPPPRVAVPDVLVLDGVEGRVTIVGGQLVIIRQDLLWHASAMAASTPHRQLSRPIQAARAWN